MPFDEDPEVEGSEGTAEAPDSQDMFGNLVEVENAGGGFSDEEEGRVEPEGLRPPPAERESAGEPTMVPLHTLHEERRLRQEQAAELARYREMAARFDEGMRVFPEQEQARMQAEDEAQKAEEEPPPDPREDPLGHEMWTQNQRMNQMSAELEQLRGYAGQADTIFRGQAVDAQVNAVGNWTRTREAQYRAAVPDYDDAYRFLLRSRAEEYNAIGMTPEQIATRLQRDQGEVIALSTQYDQNGMPVGMPGNPCHTVYELAKQRGFVPGQTKTDATGMVLGSNGHAVRGGVDGRSRIAAAQRAQRQTPGGRGGMVTSGPLNFDTIARRSDAELAQLSSTH